MESARGLKSRLKNYPLLLGKCGAEAAVYGKCVSQYMGEVRHKACEEEFKIFKNCLLKNAKIMGGKL